MNKFEKDVLDCLGEWEPPPLPDVKFVDHSKLKCDSGMDLSCYGNAKVDIPKEKEQAVSDEKYELPERLRKFILKATSTEYETVFQNICAQLQINNVILLEILDTLRKRK